MQTLSSLSFVIMLLFLQINRGMMSDRFDVFKPCECEQLLYQFECESITQCEYKDNNCVSKPCEKRNQKECSRGVKCALPKGYCKDFESCSNMETKKECLQYSDLCYYNEVKDECEIYDKIQKPDKCKDLSFVNCENTIAKEGLCFIYKNGECRKLTDCEEDIGRDSRACKAAGTYCYVNQESMCQTKVGCNHFASCDIAPVSIGSSSYIVCEKQGYRCQEWNVTEQTEDDCFVNSKGYYHWTGSKCEVCNAYSTMLIIASIFMYLIL